MRADLVRDVQGNALGNLPQARIVASLVYMFARSLTTFTLCSRAHQKLWYIKNCDTLKKKL